MAAKMAAIIAPKHVVVLEIIAAIGGGILFSWPVFGWKIFYLLEILIDDV